MTPPPFIRLIKKQTLLFRKTSLSVGIYLPELTLRDFRGGGGGGSQGTLTFSRKKILTGRHLEIVLLYMYIVQQGVSQMTLCKEKISPQQYAPLQGVYKPDPKAFFSRTSLRGTTTQSKMRVFTMQIFTWHALSLAIRELSENLQCKTSHF